MKKVLVLLMVNFLNVLVRAQTEDKSFGLDGIVATTTGRSSVINTSIQTTL